MLSNLILGVILVVLVALRDLCKRISQSDCEFGEHGLRIKLPTFRDPPPRDVTGGDDHDEVAIV